MMDQELKQKWVKALRSGEYQQGRYKLRSLDDKYCCLRVLCSVMGIPSTPTKNDYDFEGLMGTITPAYLQKAGLSEDDQGKLIILNDDDRLPFSEIATYIEANL